MRIDTVPFGAPCWIDLMTSDVEGARAFYGQLLGWTSEEPNQDFGGYVNFQKDGVRIAGCMAKEAGNPVPDLWSIYLAVEDAEATIASAVAHGSTVIVPAMPVGDLGTMGLVTDVGGAAVGLWQPGEHRGFGFLAEPGAPGWFELFTRDHAASVRFYEDVFGWTTSVQGDTDEFRYTTLGEGEEQRAGIMDASGFLPEGVPAHWSVYFAVEDTDATLAKVKDLGGDVVVPAENTPYGRLATATDPTGAVFKLVG
jgi:predicted enzyme related to lactoylglutathione lyase